MSLIPFQLIYDLPSSTYHSAENSYSSTQLKDMIKDPEYFHRKYVTKEIEREENVSHFDVGTYFHTALLEPEKLEKECCVYDGGTRYGKKWDDFKKAHSGMAIITIKEFETAKAMISGVRNSPIAMNLLKNSQKEVSASIDIYVFDNEVYAIKDDDVYMLISDGWAKTSNEHEADDIVSFGTKIRLKVRADAIDLESGIISDLKSTQGNVKDIHAMKEKISSYMYDLSASLYLDVFTLVGDRVFDEFVWIFASKDSGISKSYRASHKNKMVGRAKWKKAVIELAYYITNDWEFTDQLGELEPAYYELAWI